MEEKRNYEVTISCTDDGIYSTSKTFEELEELKDGNEISIIVSKV